MIARRWSGRAFDPARPVSRDTILALVEAARWSPSCFGDEPWRYIVFDRQTEPEAWHKAFDCLAEGNQSWAASAPLLLLAVASLRFSNNDKSNRWAQYDTGAAGMSLCIQATSMDLMVHQMGGFDVEKAMASFSIPEGFEPMAMMAIGYQLPPEAIPKNLEERERAPRRRNPLSKNFFSGSWGNPLS